MWSKGKQCYGRPLLQAWLLPDLNTKSNNCVRENSLKLRGNGIGFWCTRSLVRILPAPYISAMHLFICFLVTDFICKKKKTQKSIEYCTGYNNITEIMFNPFPNKPWLLCVCRTSLSKTLWEKEKLLITSNFSFSHSVFYPIEELFTIFIEFKIVVCKLFQFGEAENLSFGKGLNCV